MFDARERSYLADARLGRLATADSEGRPHVVPVCFALLGEAVVTPIDEKPKAVEPGDLRRTRDIHENPRVALVVDHYATDWDDLGWVQVRGTAERVDPGEPPHAAAVSALRGKYDQYATHALEERPLIHVAPGSVRSWGSLDAPARQ